MLQELLKQTTKPYHDSLEQTMFVGQIMSGALTVKQYQQLLLANYLSHAYFEQYLADHLSPALRTELNIEGRVKLPALVKDLEELQLELPALPADINITPIEPDDASILGAMYVFEGATLGGHVIVKQLLNNANLKDAGLHFHYYQVYGADLINKWKQFCQVLNTAVSAEDNDKAVNAAGDMFKNMLTFAQYAVQETNKQEV